jgi:AmpD protein
MASGLIDTRELTSLFYDRRPQKCAIDTIVIHNMYASGKHDPYCPKACLDLLNFHQVSAHFFIGRDGIIYRTVPIKFRAWHAGVSQMPFSNDRRTQVNDFSVGIEVIGDEKSEFTDEQYISLKKLCEFLCSKNPICAIVSHRAIAPGRKIDPWPNFDWSRFKNGLPKKLKVSD